MMDDVNPASPSIIHPSSFHLHPMTKADIHRLTQYARGAG
jgi:hypothetical protein